MPRGEQQTSIKSYLDLIEEQKLGKRQLEVLRVLKQEPLTDLEITKRLGKLDPNYVRPRRNELVKHLLVKKTGRRICKVSGRLANVWKVA